MFRSLRYKQSNRCVCWKQRSRWPRASSIAGISVSNPVEGMDVRLLHLCVVPLRRADHVFRGVLPSACVCVRVPNCVWSKNFNRRPSPELRHKNSVIGRLTGRDSSVGIATRYGLGGPGIEFQWRRDFPHPSSPALEPTQLPIEWIPNLCWG